MSKGLSNFLILIKREREEFARIGIFLVIFSFFAFYSLRLLNFPIIFAATPTPSPPSVSNSPEPQKGGSSITFSSNAQPGAPGELIKLLICRTNTNLCVLGSQWGYRKPITISNSGSSALTDYQVLVTNPIYNETGLVLSLHFNEGSGTVAFDSSGNNNNGNLVNGPTWVDGKFGKALQFNGVNQKVSIPETPSLRFGSGNFAIAVWMKSNVSQRQWMVSHYAGTNPGWGCGVADTTGRAAFYTRSSAGTTEVRSSRVITDGQWHFVVCQRVGNEFRIYIDGVLDASQTFAHTSVDNTASLAIGEEANYNRQWFNGIIDEVRIYNRALSDAEIQALYQAKARLDYGDIRFTDSDGSTLLNYWQEADGRFWVKVPSIPASSTKTIYVYYGNPSATSLSNGDATFDFFDDFLGAGLNMGKWQVVNSGSGTYSLSNREITIASVGDWWGTSDTSLYIISKASFSYNYIAETKVTGNSYDSWQRMFGLRASSATNSRMFVFLVDGDASHITHVFRDSDGASASWYGENTGVLRPSFPFILKFVRVGNTVYGYVNDNLANSRTVANWALNYIALTDTRGTTNTNKFDWIRVRKYTSPEPTTSVGSEEVLSASNFIYTQSSAVSSNPSATYTCPSCQYSSNTYYGVAYSVNASVWTAFTAAQTFTCKMEASQSGSCSCTNNTQCYNPCNVNWGTYYDGYCYNNKCYDAIPGSAFGLTQSCLAGTLLNHETSSGRYANVNGRLYYCRGSDNSVSPYPFVFNLSPGSSVGNCKCKQEGSWSCPTGIIPIRGGRIRIV